MKKQTHSTSSVLAAALLAGVLLAHAPASAQSAPPQASTDSKALGEQIRSTGRRGFLIEASRGGRRLFVYGGATVGRTEFFPLNPALMQGLAQSSVLLLDANPTNAKAFAQAMDDSGRLPAGTSLGAVISPESATHLRSVLAALKADPAPYQGFRPWLAAVALRQQFAAANGYDAGQNTVLYLVGYAQGANLPIVEIEGAQAQVRLLAGMSIDAQKQFLDQTLTGITSGQERRKLQWLVDDGWARGNHLPVVQATAAEADGGAPYAAYAAFHSRVWMAARSQRMADAIERAMEGNNAVPMVALPASSILGQGALLNELVKRGFAIKDLQQ